MSPAIHLAKTLILNRARAQRSLRYLTVGTSIMVVIMMFIMSRTRAVEFSQTPDVVEYSAWRILAGLLFTLLATGIAEIGSEPEQEFLTLLGLRGYTYLWGKWLDLGVRSIPWLLWSVSWGVATSPSIPGEPLWVMLAFSGALFLYAWSVGGVLGFGLELLLRRSQHGQKLGKSAAMSAPLALVLVMMGLGNNTPVPVFLHSLSHLSPIGHFHSLLFNNNVHSGVAVLLALSTIVPWIIGLWGMSLVWDFHRSGPWHAAFGKTPVDRKTVHFDSKPFVSKDLLMLRRSGLTLFRGVLAAAFLIIPFTFLNTRADVPLFLRFFQVMIIVAASGMMFGLMLPAMDKEVLWLIRTTGKLRSYVFQKFALVAAITGVFSALIITPLSLTVGVPLTIIAPLALVGTCLVSSLSLIASAIANRLRIDMGTRPDTNLVMGMMLIFGLFLSTTVLGYMVSVILFAGFLVLWSVVCFAGLGVAVYLFHTQDIP